MAGCLTKRLIKLKDPIESGDRWITEINVPCGNCARCIERRKMEWGFRMEHEMNNSKTAYFITLTYAPEVVPYNKYGHKTLVKNDLTLFFKRLRQNQIRSDVTIEHLRNGLDRFDKIKYYACGEYGEERGRPHFHAVVFNCSERNVLKSWPFGEVHCVKASRNTIAYLMKYLDKRLDKVKEWKKEPEYNTMSEGIGLDYLKRMSKWHKNNIEILYVCNNKGFKVPMPRYFRDKIFDDIDKRNQVLLIQDVLLKERTDLINEVGLEDYNTSQNSLIKEIDKRFKKKCKKRVID